MHTTKKLILCLIITYAFTACSSQNIFVTEHKDAWFNDPDKGLVYCKANIKTNGSADPICFETAFQRYEEAKK